MGSLEIQHEIQKLGARSQVSKIENGAIISSWNDNYLNQAPLASSFNRFNNIACHKHAIVKDLWFGLNKGSLGIFILDTIFFFSFVGG